MRPTMTITYPHPSAKAGPVPRRKWSPPLFSIAASRASRPVEFTPHTPPKVKPPQKYVP